MTTKKNARAEAGKDTHGNSKSKTRISMICPCCGGEVTHRRYSFDVVVGAPMRWKKWYVCDECETALSGNDPVAMREAENAFIKYLEGTDDAPAP